MYEKKIIKGIYKKIIKIDLLEYLRMLYFDFNFVMIYIVHKILALRKNHLKGYNKNKT